MNDAVVTSDPVSMVCVGAQEADTAHDEVPSSEPVIPFVTVRDPVIIALPFTSSFAFGTVVPIPTLPEEETINLSAPRVKRDTPS